MDELDEWCSHITSVLGEYEIYGKYVPVSWIVCPECGTARPD